LQPQPLQSREISRTTLQISITNVVLVAVQDIRKQWRLVYSKNDTIYFLVDDPEEAINIFYAIDPTL
jgi:hypothetical protein